MVGANHRGGTISKKKLWIPYIFIEMPMETIFLFLYIEIQMWSWKLHGLLKLLKILICCRK